MEQNGGTQPIGRPPDVITLAAPRPGAARRQNEYIETPLRLHLDEAQPCKGGGAITSQPAKEKALDSGGEGSEGQADESIICRRCRRCKCESCRAPRRLPATWVCDDKCLCSARNVVDYCSCVCCVKGLFYHWAKDYDDSSCADQPCSCAPHQRVLRWACLGFLSLPLPCLCCYWPLRGCAALGDRCYGRCPSPGCRCHRTSRLLAADC